MKIFNLFTSYLKHIMSLINIFTISLITVSVLILFSGCSGSQTGSEQWEGISKGILKVTIYEFFLFEEKSTRAEIKNQIMERLNQRAALLIASHLSMNLSRDKISKQNDLILNNKLDEILQSGELTEYVCGENNYCSAYGEYKITGLIQTLEMINNE